MPSKYLIIALFGIIPFLFFQSSSAKDGFESLYKDGPIDDDYDESLDEKWKEGKVTIPSLPNEDDLIPIAIDKNRTRFQHFIDKKTISVGEDRVIRYSIVLKSTNGVSNVFYEGIRCATKEYRTYAIASGNKFNPMKKSKWKYIGHSHYYRLDLYENYLCDRMSNSPFNKDQVVRRIEHNDEYQGWMYD